MIGRTVITAVLWTMLAGEVPAQESGCDRHCLGERLDAYLRAVTRQDPGQAPLAVGFRQTENARVVRLGMGLWQTATGLGPVDRRYFDTAAGQAAFFGIVAEGDRSAIAAVRIRIERNRISEAEWYIGRAGDPGMNDPANPEGTRSNIFDLDNLVTNPPPERAVPPGERLPREDLMAIANSYFDGITGHDGKIIQAHPGCARTENGFQTTGRPLPEERKADGYEGQSDCTSNMGGFAISLVAARRFLLIDEEAQVVLATAVFLRDPGSARRRNSFTELFFIDQGRIRKIYAAMFYPPPEQPVPNWPPYDGNFPPAASPTGE